MHELSIAHSLVGLVQEHLPPGVTQVRSVALRVGALSGVAAGALEFCYDVATAGTPLAGSVLRIEAVPIVIHCAPCDADRTLDGRFVFRCPVCQTPSADIRQGKDLDLAAIEYDDPEPVAR